jgi:small-conductance mechanosensitive channel/CRP-like cAMP-binding protein
MDKATLLRAWPTVTILFLVTATLVNRFAPERRKRLQRGLFYVVAGGIAYGIGTLVPDGSRWDGRLSVLSEILGLMLTVDVLTLLVLDVVLPKLRISLPPILSDITTAVAYVVGILGVLASAGMRASDVFATSAIVSGIIAISFQPTLGNIVGGLALQLDGSVREGDWVQLENGRQGRVRQVRWRHAVLEQRDSSIIIVPNAMLLAQSIILLGRRNGETVPQRMNVFFNVDFRFAPARVVQVVQDALQAAPIPRVAEDPKPSVVCMDLARDGRDSFALYCARYHLTDLAADDPTSSDVRVRIYTALKRAGIPLARPVQSLFINPDDNDEAKSRSERQHERRMALMESMDFFRPLTMDERHELASGMTHSPFAPGEIITRQGAVAHFLYILASGTVEIVHREREKSAQVVAEVSAPDYFGEMGMMTGEPRRADVVAKTEVECIRVDKASFETFLLKRPELAAEMATKLAARRVELAASKMSAEERVSQVFIEQANIAKKVRDFFGLQGNP